MYLVPHLFLLHLAENYIGLGIKIPISELYFRVHPSSTIEVTDSQYHFVQSFDGYQDILISHISEDTRTFVKHHHS